MPRIATDLLLLARNPGSGTLRHQVALERCIRSALFAELALAGALRSDGRSPAAAGLEPTGDPVLDAVRAAVDARPGVTWPRWFRHVADDREVLVRHLIEDGRWEAGVDVVRRHSYVDTEPEQTVDLTYATLRVAEQTVAPADAEQACLAILTVTCGAIVGRPRPREFRRNLLPLLDVVGTPGDPVRRTVQVALAAGAHAVRKRRRFLG